LFDTGLVDLRQAYFSHNFFKITVACWRLAVWAKEKYWTQAHALSSCCRM